MSSNSNPATIHLTLQGSRIPSLLSIQPVISWVGNVTSALTQIYATAASFSHPVHSTPLAAPCDRSRWFQGVPRRSALGEDPKKKTPDTISPTIFMTRISRVPCFAQIWDLKFHLGPKYRIISPCSFHPNIREVMAKQHKGSSHAQNCTMPQLHREHIPTLKVPVVNQMLTWRSSDGHSVPSCLSSF